MTVKDMKLSIAVEVTGWSPFTPTDADNSSLPVGGLEYRFSNTGARTLEYVYSFNSPTLPDFRQILSLDKGFILSHDTAMDPPQKAAIAFFTAHPRTLFDYYYLLARHSV